MSAMRAWFRRLAATFGWGRGDRDLEEELRSHVALAGDSREARLEAGGVAQALDALRDQRTLPWLADGLADVGYAARAFRKSGGFAAVATLTLGLGIGASAAIFSLVNQILLHPRGIAEPERILVVRTTYRRLNLSFDQTSAHIFADLRTSRSVFEQVAAMRPASFNHAGADRPVRLQAAAVSADWFDVFGARPALGRVFGADEDQPGSNRVAVLAHGAWMRLFGGDANVDGKTIDLDQQPYLVIGVMPREFSEPSATDVWVPLALSLGELAAPRWANDDLSIFARTSPRISFAEADSWLRLTADRLLDQAPPAVRTAVASAGWGLRGARFVDAHAGTSKTSVLILLGSVVVVLLIACANVAGLMLARTSARGQELAVRAALGAGRGRLLRQVFAESALLGTMGAGAGLLLARGGVSVLLRIAPDSARLGLEPHLDWHVLLFAVTAGLASAVLFGLAPAWQMSRVDLHDVLHASGRGITRGRHRLRSVLVVAEVAATITLLVSAGLLLRSLARLQHRDPGFEPRGVLTAAYALPHTLWQDPESQVQFTRSVLERLRGLPGVTTAAMGRPIPFSGVYEGASFRIEGRTPRSGEAIPQGERRWVTPDYFRTLQVPLLRGRVLDDDDRADTEPVTVIDDKLSRLHFPDADPLDRRIQLTSGGQPFRIVGVVQHVMQSNLAADTDGGVFYVSLLQQPMPIGWILVKTSTTALDGATDLQRAVGTVNPTVPLYDIATMEGRLEARMFDWATVAWLSLLVMTTGFVACYWPSRRAMHVDPVEVLRTE